MKFFIKYGILSVFILKTALFVQNSLHAQQYWQQEANYTIKAFLNDSEHSVQGLLSVSYINNSPDTIREVPFHLWPNAYHNQDTKLAEQMLQISVTDFYYSLEDERGKLDGIQFKSNQKILKHYYEENNEIVTAILVESLMPGDSITIETPFYVQIPKQWSRLGRTDSAYQITQWYPKVVKYAPEMDQNGIATGNIKWHKMPYLNLGEFYSDFGNYDVSISVPEEYVVAATGKLVDRRDRPDLKIETKVDTSLVERNYKTEQYQQNSVVDFAFFLDQNFLQEQEEFEVDGKKILAQVYYQPAHKTLWKDSALQYAIKAVGFYSEKVGPYPYETVTVVDGGITAGGGMEYPTITIVGGQNSALGLERVIVHEVGHNWFEAILASNERQFPFMDEGINSYYENRYFRESNKNRVSEILDAPLVANLMDIKNFSYEQGIECLHRHLKSNGLDQSIHLHATEYNMLSYGTVIYLKSASLFQQLEYSLGKKYFDEIMKEYFNLWAMKHPNPQDLRNVFEANSPTNVSWFFDDILIGNKTIDYSINQLYPYADKIGEKVYDVVRITNKEGQIESPFSLTAFKNDSAIRSIKYDGVERLQDILFPSMDYDYMILDAKHLTLEQKRENNRIKRTGILKRWNPLSLNFAGGVDDPYKTEINYLPWLGYNIYDGLSLGVLLFNKVIPRGNFYYNLKPQFAFKSQELVGSGEMGLDFSFKNNIVQSIGFRAEYESFHEAEIGLNTRDFEFNESRMIQDEFRYHKVSPSLQFIIRNDQIMSHWEKKLTLTSNMIYKEDVNLVRNDTIFNQSDTLIQNGFVTNQFRDDYVINTLKLEINNDKRIMPYGFSAMLEQHEKFGKLSLEGKIKFHYPKKKKGIQIRAFAGGFLWDNFSSGADRLQFNQFRFKASGSGGANDYLYEETFGGRNENDKIWSQQVLLKDGYSRVKTHAFNGDEAATFKWAYSINAEIDFPKKLPVSAYVNLSKVTDNEFIIREPDLIQVSMFDFVEIGASIKIIPDVFEIYIPLLLNDKLKQASNITMGDKWAKKITFKLNFKSLKLLQQARSGSFLN